MALTRRQIDRLLQAIKSHTDWLYSTITGVELSAAEINRIKQFNLPLDLDADLIRNGYALGLLRMLLKQTEYADVSFDTLLETTYATRTPTETLAVNQAMLTAGRHMKNLAEDIGNEAFEKFNAAGAKALTEATIKDVVKDTVAFGLIRRKNYMQVATDLASNLKTDWRRDWRRVAETELQKAKVQGMVQALVNKKDIFKYSEGVESNVSIVPSPDTCGDCAALCLNREGNPKVVKLSWLIAQGSNGDDGVNHSKTNGIHTHWKMTLPPVHPRCGCSVVYVPPGYGWAEGKLVLIDKDAFKQSMLKGMELSKAKEYTPFSPTAKPMGPASVKAEAPHMASLPGVDSPAKAVTPTAAPKVSVKAPGSADPTAKTDTATSTGNEQEAQACPLGQQACEALGFSGKHHPNSKVFQDHARMAGKQGAAAPEAEDPNKHAQALAQASEWQKKPHAPSVVASKLASGKVLSAERLTVEAGGVTRPYKLVMEDGPSGCFKPERAEALDVFNFDNVPIAEAVGVTAENTSHKREVAAYQHDASYGNSQVPVTAYRTHEGQEGSIQHWQEDSHSAPDAFAKMDPDVASAYQLGGGTVNYAKYVMEQGDDKQQAVKELSRSVCHDIMKNHTDRHSGNMRFSVKDGALAVHNIDNADSFGRGLDLFRNDVFSDLSSSGFKVTIPEDLESKMRTRSFGDEERAVGGHISKKETAETFIRTKYLLHLQDTEGHLDYKHFMCFTRNTDSEDEGAIMPHPRDAKRRGAKKMNAIVTNEGSPHQKYMKFESEYLQKMEDPSHPHHGDLAKVKEALATQDRPLESPSKKRKQQISLMHSETKSGMAAFEKLQEAHKERLKNKYNKSTPVAGNEGNTDVDSTDRTMVGNSMDRS